MTSCPRRRRGSILGHRTYQKTNTSSVKMPPTHQKIWPIMNMFPVLVSNNWYFGKQTVTLCSSSHSTNHQQPGLSNLFSKLLRLQHTLIWDGMVSVPYLIHETSTDVLFIWHRDPSNGTSRVAMWAALDKTSCSFRNSCKSCWKEKNATRQMYHPKNSSSKKNTSFWLVSTVCIRFSQRKCLEQKQNPLVHWSFTEISGNFWCLTVFMRSLQTIGSQLTYRTKNMQKLQSLCLRKKNQSSWDCPSSVKSQPLYSRCFARVGQEKCTCNRCFCQNHL